MTALIVPFRLSKRQWTPREYQRGALDLLTTHKSFGLFLQPGLGKTSVTLEAIRQLKEAGEVQRVLVVAPLRVCQLVWPAELDNWSNFEGLTHTVLHGKHKTRLLEEKTDIHIINFEGLPWLFSKVGKRHGYDMVVIDELTKIKDTRTQRFRLIRKVIDTFPRRYGLTGSPVAEEYEGLFGQVFFIDKGDRLGKFITQYRMRYFDKSYDGFTWKIKKGAEREIASKIADITLTLKAGDHIDMPSLVENIVRVELPPAAVTTYRQMQRDKVAQLGGDLLTAASAAVVGSKLRQLANGAVYIDELGEERTVQHIHDEKVEALKMLVEELQGQPLLVGYDFNHDLERLQAAFPGAPNLGSGVSGEKARAIQDLWNAGLVPVLFAHPMSAGHGLNLQGAGNNVAWFSIPQSFDQCDQFVRRVWRSGNEYDRVFVHYIVAKGTIDEHIIDRLKHKEAGQNLLFEIIKELRACQESQIEPM